MKAIICENCGSTDLYEEKGYRVCRYCGTKHVISEEDRPAKYSTIELNKDVEELLKKAKEDPSRAKKYAERVLEIDPNNQEAKNYLRPETTSSGCYIATAIYGSYNCPQVWTLRRFRDYTLAETWFGRLFIILYYAISPTLVKCFGETVWFKNMWKPKLDRMVKHLNEAGVADTPYQDRQW